jgi:hypothetical protein
MGVHPIPLIGTMGRIHLFFLREREREGKKKAEKG